MAGFGSKPREPRAEGEYIFHVVEKEDTVFEDKAKKETREQWAWKIDVQTIWSRLPTGQAVKGDGSWRRDTIYTGRAFSDPAKADKPQFVAKLNKLCRALGLPIPTNAEQAAAWDEALPLGRQGGIIVRPSLETGQLEEFLVPISSLQSMQQAPTAQAAPPAVQAPVVQAPVVQHQPVYAAPPAAAPQPVVQTWAPPPAPAAGAPSDPFADAPQAPAPAAVAAVTGAQVPWE